MIVLESIFLFIFCSIIWILWNRRKFYLLHFKLPGRLGYPLIGSGFDFLNLEDVIPNVEKYLKTFGSIFYIWLGPIPLLFLSDPQTIKEVLSEESLKKGSIYYPFDDCMGPSLFSMDDPEYTAHRRLLNVAFQPKVLNSFFPIFNEETTDLIRCLDDLVDKGEVDLELLLYTFTLNVAARTTMGTNMNSETPAKKEEIIIESQYLIARMADLFTKPWLRIKPLRRFYKQFNNYEKCKKMIHDYIRSMVNGKIQEKTENWKPSSETEKNIAVNLAIDHFHSGIFTAQNLQDHCLNIIGGAIETSASVLLNILMLLAMFPEYEKILFEEIRGVLPDKDNCDVTTSDVQNIPYMDLVINEALRVLPTIPIVIREVDKEFKLSNGVTLPKGLRIAIVIFEVHRRKDIWGPDAHTFNPDHFLPSNMEERHPYSFIPFMKGKRNCIGWRYALLSLKLTLARVLRHYRFTTTFKFEDLKFVEDIKLKFKEVPLLEVHRRNS